MMLNNVNVNGQNIAEHFAGYFDRKVSAIVNETIVDPRVYKMYEDIPQCVMYENLKCKNDMD